MRLRQTGQYFQMERIFPFCQQNQTFSQTCLSHNFDTGQFLSQKFMISNFLLFIEEEIDSKTFLKIFSSQVILSFQFKCWQRRRRWNKFQQKLIFIERKKHQKFQAKVFFFAAYSRWRKMVVKCLTFLAYSKTLNSWKKYFQLARAQV